MKLSTNRIPMRRLRTIIIDDEAPGRINLERMIGNYCPHIEVAGSFESAEKAKAYLDDAAVDAVFLDICMPKTNGFDFIHSFNDPPFAVVFVTAHREYAIRAIRASAVDYLLKPILPDDLKQAEMRLLKSVGTPAAPPLQVLSENLSTDSPRKLVVHHAKGFQVLDTEKIIRLEADGNYTTFYLQNERPVLVSKPIGVFEPLLDPASFVRVHKSHIIHLEYFEQYVVEDANYALLMGGHRVEVSRRRAAAFFERVSEFTSLRKNYKR